MAKTRWNDEMRKRLRGCPREVKEQMKAEREAIRLLYIKGLPVKDVEAVRAACAAFDRRLRELGYTMDNSSPLHP